MEWLIALAGLAVILVGILDIFFTVLHYDGFGFLSSRLYNGLFSVARAITRPLPLSYRALGLSMAAPLMVPVTITVWISLVAGGYALIYYAGMSTETFLFTAGGLRPSLVEAVYFSGVSIATLGLGDVTPLSSFYQILAVSEALIGFGILTLAISYVIGVYEVLQRLGTLSAGLYHQARDTSDPLDVLIPHFPNGQPRGLESHLMSVHRDLVEVYEGIRRYPIVYYYHSRRAYRSLPYTFRMAGGIAAALRWGLPQDHPASQTPFLPTLITGIETIITYLDERFLSEPLEAPPVPLPFATFEAALERDESPPDPWLDRFLQIESFMRDLAELDAPPDTAEAYERYNQWLPFAYQNRAFFEASASELGYELHVLEGGPGEKLF